MSTSNQNGSNFNSEVDSHGKTSLPQKQKIVVDKKLPVHLSVCDFYQTAFTCARRLETGILEDQDSKYLHQYRVYLRKTRAIASSLKELKTEITTQEFIPSLRALMKETNRLRDLDVYLMKSDAFYNNLDEKHHPGLARFFEDIALLRYYELNRVTEWLSSELYQQKCRDVEQQISAISASLHNKTKLNRCTEYGSKLLKRHYGKVYHRAELLNEQSKDEEIHQLRISCKKLRYLLEFFSPILDKSEYQQKVQTLKSLQDCLGEFNDASVQADFLNSYLKHIQSDNPAYKAVSHLKDLTKDNHQTTRKQILTTLSSLSPSGLNEPAL